VVRAIYRQLLAGIRKATSLTREQYLFFELHCLVDDQHQKDLLSIAGDLIRRPGGIEQLRAGMLFALDLRVEFWDALYERALRMGVAA
jgi:pyrroloquinoline-quinone synthase